VLAANALPSGETCIAVSVGIAPEWLARMPGYGSEIMRTWGGVDKVNAYPLDEPILVSQATDKSTWKGNRWITEWAEPQGLIDAVTIPLRETGQWWGISPAVDTVRPAMWMKTR
jgi:hypothetical protein